VSRFIAAVSIGLLISISSPLNASAQRGGEVTVTISPAPEIKAELPYYAAYAEHRLHFQNTTSRDAKILSMEFFFVDQLERNTNCDNFFGVTIGASIRKYDLKDILVPSAKSAAARTKFLPPEFNDGRVEPAFHDDRVKRYTLLGCYRFKYELDGAELEVNALAGRWVFERKTGKLISKNVAGKAELLPR
jgi:hypothetical protein